MEAREGRQRESGGREKQRGKATERCENSIDKNAASASAAVYRPGNIKERMRMRTQWRTGGVDEVRKKKHTQNMQHVCECAGGVWGCVGGGAGRYVGFHGKQCRLCKTAGCAEVHTREHIMGRGWVEGTSWPAGWLAGRTIAPRGLMGCGENSPEREREERADV